MKRKMSKTYIQFTFFFVILLVPISLYAYVMGSGSYRIDSDSINIGGNNSSSASYKSEDTIGEIATGISSSTLYTMNAGYQTMHSSYISISSQHNGTMSSVNGLLGGETNASTTWTVLTDNSAGYQLTIKTDQNPAMRGSGGSYFDDYDPATSDPDFSFSYLNTEALFGFSPEGVDVSSRFRDNGAICNVGGLDSTDACWDGLDTIGKIIATGAVANHPNGATTTVKYRAAIGSNKIQDSGSYSAVITVTATTL
jgi:hypothetical protein